MSKIFGLFVVLALVGSAHCYSAGAGTCDSAWDGGTMGGMTKQTTDNPYTLSSSSHTDFSATVSTAMTFQIDGAPYKGLLAYVVMDGDAVDGTVQKGAMTFASPWKQNTATACANTASLTHEDGDDKSSTDTFVWTAPATAGTYQMRGIVASGGSSVTDTRTQGYWEFTQTITITADPCAGVTCTSGTCEAGTCACDAGYSGTTCSTVDCYNTQVGCAVCVDESECEDVGCTWSATDGTGTCGVASGASNLQVSFFAMVFVMTLGFFNNL